VNHFDLAQSFIERCKSSARSADLAAAFQQALETLGFRYFACCSHVDPLKPPRWAVMLDTYPEEWVRSFSELQLYEIDPVFIYANRTLLPFFWDAPEFRASLTPLQQEILIEANRYGIAHGHTIPIHSPNSPNAFRASCSVVPDAASIEPSSYATVQLMACYLYDAASREADGQEARAVQRKLSRRERQCLELAAQGKSDWVAGRLLGISERTVHNHIENAKRRLGVATRVQAIVHALATRQISFGDVIKSEPSEQLDELRSNVSRRNV
jgi:DNA-binding CsgD family transcriptional regulator